MNLLSGLINEYKSEQLRRRAAAEASEASEVNKREWVRREGLHQISTKGALTNFELAELMDGSETSVSKNGYAYTVRVDCPVGFVLTITWHDSPQTGGGVWGGAEIYEATADGGLGACKWLSDRAGVVEFIGSRLTAGGA